MTSGAGWSGDAADVIRAHFPVPLCFAFCCLVHSQEGDSQGFILPGSSSAKKKRASVCPRQSSNYDYSDWTSLGLGSLFNPSYLVGSCCALMGLDQLPAGVRSGSTGSKPIHQGGGAGPQKETESLVGIQEYRRRAAGNLQPRLLKITGRCPKSVMEQGQSQQSLEERWGC